VEETLVPLEKWDFFSTMTPKDVVACAGPGMTLHENDIIIDQLQLNYAMKDKNPVDNVHFFTKWGSSDAFTLRKEEVSLLIPSQFSERYLRVFCRDPEKAPEIQEAYRLCLSQRNITPSPAFSLPPSPNKLPKK